VLDSGSPTVRRRRLAAELRRLRERSGMTAETVGRALGWSTAKISRYELARSGLRPSDVEMLLDFYSVSRDYREQLLALAEEATRKGWWEAYSDILTVEDLAFIGLEAEAASVMEWQINVIPDLLQTQDYARQVISGYQEVTPIPPTVIERRVETRVIREQLLTRNPPLDLAAVLDESVLYRQRGDRAVMRDQLERLATASELPNVNLRVLPLKTDHRLSADSFVILHFGREGKTTLRDVVNTEILNSQLYIEGETDTYEFSLAFEHLVKESLTPAKTRDFIWRTARQI
jgi:transcriptional regulator with XRE-family HTH domain